MNLNKFFGLIFVFLMNSFLNTASSAPPSDALKLSLQSSPHTNGKVEIESFSPVFYYSVSGFAKPVETVISGSFLIDNSNQLSWNAGFDGATNLISGKCTVQFIRDPQSGRATGITGQCATGTIDSAGKMQITWGGPGYNIQGAGDFYSWFGRTGTLTVTPKPGYTALGVWDNTTPVGVLFEDSTGAFMGGAGLYQSITGWLDAQGRGAFGYGETGYAAITTTPGQQFAVAVFQGKYYCVTGTTGNFFAVDENQKIVATGSIVSVAENDPMWIKSLQSQGSPLPPEGFNAILQVNGISSAGHLYETFAQFWTNAGMIMINLGH